MVAELQRTSRYRYCYVLYDDDGIPYLTEREPYLFRALNDNASVIARGDDHWPALADRAYHPEELACNEWWAILDFQPSDDREPVIDPTLAIEAGTEIVTPSRRTKALLIRGEERRREA